jgi:hypothetical protein
MTRGGGRLRAASPELKFEPMELMLLILDVESDLE